MSQRILVTGGTGMVGSALVRRLVTEQQHVTVMVRAQSNLLRLQEVANRLHFVEADIRDAEAVRRAIHQTRPEVVYHLASTSFNPPTATPLDHMNVIMMGTLHLLEALVGQPHVRIIATGSAFEYGSGSRLGESHPLVPNTILGAAKANAGLLMTTYARLHGLTTVFLRVFTPYGPWERPSRLVPLTILSALNGRDIPISSGVQQRDYFYVDDLVNALCLASERSLSPGTVLNVCSSQGISVKRMVELILQLMGNPVKMLVAALPTRPDEVLESSGDNSTARAVLGWEPQVGLEDGLRRTIAWFREHRELAVRLT